MSEFKVGDRVRYTCRAYGTTGTGVVERDDGTDFYRYLVRANDGTYPDPHEINDLGTGVFGPEELTLTTTYKYPYPVAVTLPAGDYFGRKFDAGKPDYTLLPARVVAAILEHEQVLREDPDFRSCCEQDGLAASMESLLEYRYGGDLDALLDAYVYACRDRVVESLGGVVKVLEHGAAKYARDSWREVPNASARYFSAACRHAHDISRGIAIDADSRLYHWDHYRTNLIFQIGLDVQLIEQAKVAA